MNIKAGATDAEQPIGGGTAAFVNFSPTNQLTIHFKVVDKFRPDRTAAMPMPMAGCKKLTEFKAIRANVQRPSVARVKLRGLPRGYGNANARGAMDITGIACGRRHRRCRPSATRFARASTSRHQRERVLHRAEPGEATNHPFKFDAASNFDDLQERPWTSGSRPRKLPSSPLKEPHEEDLSTALGCRTRGSCL